MKRLILASNSPRRKQLLSDFGFEFEVIPSDYNENGFFRSPKQTVKNFAFQKALCVFNNLSELDRESAVVLGADTIVVSKNKILGKPKDANEAKEMLASLSNRAHFVYTGYCILQKGKFIIKAVKTKVVFNRLSNTLIDEYVASKKPLDKAGAYGIQDGFALVKAYHGSYNNVVGLPIEKLNKKLKKALGE